MTYTSHIFVTVDAVVLKKNSQLNTFDILLIQRLNEPFKDSWALPGGFVDFNEDLLQAASRELEEETSLKLSNLKQLKAYGAPGRDPRGHMISISYGTILYDDLKIKAKDDAKEVSWFSIDKLPELAFDHHQIINDAIEILIQ